MANKRRGLKLAADLRQDRLARGLAWPAYAKLLGVPLTTLYKLCQGYVNRPHETTLRLLRVRLEERQAEKPGTECGREMVSDGR